MSNSKVSFRRLADGDSKTILDWRNNPDVARHMYTDHKISEDEHGAWFAKVLHNSAVSYWIIELDGSAVGLANVVDIDFQNRSAAWAFYLADTQTRGKGIGLYVEYCVLTCAFDYWRLDTLRCEVLETNPDVSGLHKSVGFSETGRLHARAIKAGAAVDAIAYAMTRRDWESGCKLRLEERVRARGRDPLPLLFTLESAEGEAALSGEFYNQMDSEIAQMRAKRPSGG